MSFFAEIRRRKVFQVAAVYAVVAWLLIQIVGAIGEPLSLPDWLDTVVIILLAVGFPIAVILAWAFDLTPQGIRADSNGQGSSVPIQLGGQRFTYVIQGLVLVAVGFLVVDQYLLQPEIGSVQTAASTRLPASISSSPVRRYAINLGDTKPLGNTLLSANVALSPDGKYLAYAAQKDELSQLYLRPLAEFDAATIPYTEGAFHPFFSPDGDWIGFYSEQTNEKLEKVSISGGRPQSLADAVFSAGASWVTPETIIFATNHPTLGRTLYRVSSSGGARELIAAPDPETGHVTPAVLPGGRAALFVVRPGTVGAGNARDGNIAVLSLETGEHRTLVERAFRPQYAASGHIVFVRDGGLWAVPFDLERLEITGPAVRIIDGVQQDGFTGGAAYAFSQDGLLVYVPGGDTSLGSDAMKVLTWIDRGGNEEVIDAEPRRYSDPKLSPAGDRIALTVYENGNYDIYIHDLRSGRQSQLTFAPDRDSSPIWSPDGDAIIFSSTRSGGGLFRKRADSVGDVEQLTQGLNRHTAEVFTADGQLLYVAEGGQWDIVELSMDDNYESRPILATAFNEQEPAISPDGNFLAYQTDELGQDEIFVRPFPIADESTKWRIPIGGIRPSWRSDGRALIFRNYDWNLVEVDFFTEPSVSFGSARTLVTGTLADLSPGEDYDTDPDGRFLLMNSIELGSVRSEQTQLIVVENWFTELERLAPVSR